MLLDVAHGVVDLRADVGGLGQLQQVVEARLGAQVEDAVGVVGGGFIHSAAATGRGAGLLQLRALGGEAHLGEAQEDQAEDGAGVLLGLQAGIGAELVGGIPQALFERGRGGVFFGVRDPTQNEPPRWCFGRSYRWAGAHGAHSALCWCRGPVPCATTPSILRKRTTEAPCVRVQLRRQRRRVHAGV